MTTRLFLDFRLSLRGLDRRKADKAEIAGICVHYNASGGVGEHFLLYSIHQYCNLFDNIDHQNGAGEFASKNL